MSGWRIVRVFGTEIRIHPTWLWIVFLVFMGLGAHFHQAFPHWRSFVWWLSAGAASFLFFVSIILHELAHTLVGRAYGLSIRSITLFVLGAVANMDSETENPRMEFWIAAAGPLTSAAIGFLCLGLTWPSLGKIVSAEAPQAILKWLGQINLAIAVFNLIPAFPLDGGRILRAVLWWWTGDGQRAYFWSALSGRVFALILIVFGLSGLFFGELGFNGVLLAMIGGFIFIVVPLRLPEKTEEKPEDAD